MNEHNEALIILKDIQKTYVMGNAEVRALQNLDLTVSRGEFIAVMGPSGSGKSTLLNLLGCLDRPSAGRYILNGRDVQALEDEDLALVRSSNLGFVFQSFNLLPRLNAADNIELPLMYTGREVDPNHLARLLELVGLSERKHHRPNQLSGGQQQRVALARSLVNSPPILLADEPTGNLDSKTGNEIMQLLTALNNSGLTIILVTHEEEIACHARRILRFRDGELISDVQNTPTQLPITSITLPISSIQGYANARHGVSIHELKENVRSAFKSLWQNKMRAFLTMLGILIGVGAVIAMVSIGEGAQARVRTQIEGLGSNLLSVVPGSSRSTGPIQGGAGSASTLTYDDANALRTISNIIGIAPELSSRKQIKSGRITWNTTVTGTSPDYPSVHNWKINTGAFFTEEDNKSRHSVCVIGSETATTLFNGIEPIGQTIRIDNFPYTVLGVMESKGSGGFFSRDDFILLPLETAFRKLSGQKNVRSISVQIDTKDHMATAKDEVSEMLRQRHKLLTDADNDFQIIGQDEILATAEGITGTMTMLLASIASISLLVGGIGIMNIMLVTVTERTREIGIRKALGARSIDIMLQFLVEAIALSLTGGILGLILGVTSAQLIAIIGSTPTVVSLGTVVVAIGFSVAVGLFFGLYPARKASKMDPIQALRYE